MQLIAKYADEFGRIGEWRLRVLAWGCCEFSWSNRCPIAMPHAREKERAAYFTYLRFEMANHAAAALGLGMAGKIEVSFRCR